MANTKSALKAMRVAARRRAINRPVRSAARTYVAKAVRLIEANDLDKAAEKGVIHRNNAARRKSRLMHKLNQALKAAAAPA